LKARLGDGHDESGKASQRGSFKVSPEGRHSFHRQWTWFKYVSAHAALRSPADSPMKQTKVVSLKDSSGFPKCGFTVSLDAPHGLGGPGAYKRPGWTLIGHAGGAGVLIAWIGFEQNATPARGVVC